LNICLRRAILSRDFRTLLLTLQIAERHCLLHTPACRQAAELMRRAATFAAQQAAKPRPIVPLGPTGLANTVPLPHAAHERLCGDAHARPSSDYL
jgi:hypothetical protein